MDVSDDTKRQTTRERYAEGEFDVRESFRRHPAPGQEVFLFEELPLPDPDPNQQNLFASEAPD